jgi:hypothetical protein
MGMKYFLASVFVFFIGLMVLVYWGSRQANPVMLDENGKPLTAATHGQH